MDKNPRRHGENMYSKLHIVLRKLSNCRVTTISPYPSTLFSLNSVTIYIYKMHHIHTTHSTERKCEFAAWQCHGTVLAHHWFNRPSHLHLRRPVALLPSTALLIVTCWQLCLSKVIVTLFTPCGTCRGFSRRLSASWFIGSKTPRRRRWHRPGWQMTNVKVRDNGSSGKISIYWTLTWRWHFHLNSFPGRHPQAWRWVIMTTVTPLRLRLGRCWHTDHTNLGGGV